MLCWLDKDAARPRAKYLTRYTSNEQRAMIKKAIYKMDLNSFERNNEDKELKMNEISWVKNKDY